MKLTEQQPSESKAHALSNGEARENQLYNSMVEGMHNYYRLATHVSQDFNRINRAVMTILTNRLKNQKGSRLAKTGRS